MPRRHTYRATIAYDGSRYAGFKSQPGRATVEGTLLRALQPLIPDISRVSCGGRTDRGVHATGQVISFWSRGPLPQDELWDALDSIDPDGIALRDLREVPRSFHASFSACGRRYAYFHCDGGRADAEQLDAMLGELVGERCFSAFARDTPAGRSTRRRLLAARVRRVDPDHLRFDMWATGFLRRQVRITVATALREVERGAGRERLVELAATGDRRTTARAIDGGGLYLLGVDYV